MSQWTPGVMIKLRQSDNNKKWQLCEACLFWEEIDAHFSGHGPSGTCQYPLLKNSSPQDELEKMLNMGCYEAVSTGRRGFSIRTMM